MTGVVILESLINGWLTKNFCILGRGGTAGAKFRISLALPVGAVMNCADNTGMVVIPRSK